MQILPKTSLGKWSIGLTIAFFLLFVLHQTFAATVRRNPLPNPGSPSPVILMVVVTDYVSGIISFLTGLISIIRNKERAFLVFLVVIAGFLALLFLIGEFLWAR